MYVVVLIFRSPVATVELLLLVARDDTSINNNTTAYLHSGAR